MLLLATYIIFPIRERLTNAKQVQVNIKRFFFMREIAYCEPNFDKLDHGRRSSDHLLDLESPLGLFHLHACQVLGKLHLKLKSPLKKQKKNHSSIICTLIVVYTDERELFSSNGAGFAFFLVWFYISQIGSLQSTHFNSEKNYFDIEGGAIYRNLKCKGFFSKQAPP